MKPWDIFDARSEPEGAQLYTRVFLGRRARVGGGQLNGSETTLVWRWDWAVCTVSNCLLPYYVLGGNMAGGNVQAFTNIATILCNIL